MNLPPDPSDRDPRGSAMYALATQLFPICRSITGDGLRASLRQLQSVIPMELREVPSGTPVFDWRVPLEWNVRDAYVANQRGERVIDFQRNNLHLVNYSAPFRGRMTLEELRPHLHTLPDKPEWIPYRTSYYRETWGFCLSHNHLARLEAGDYEVCVDTTLAPGSLTYGELILRGESSAEVLISCHCCHPSLANDNLSGMVLSTYLAKEIEGWQRRYSYRFLFIPGTIGSITWLALNEPLAQHIRHGLVVAGVGDPGCVHYKKSRQANAEIDRVVRLVLAQSGREHVIREFSPYGYDERQYCSPGFDLAVGCLTRTPHGQYAEYHTSADNLELIRPECLAASLSTYLAVLKVLEHNKRFVNTNPKCEPQLGRRGLYAALGGRQNASDYEMAMLWILNLSDGNSTLLDIAERSGIPFGVLAEAAHVLLQQELLIELP
jgi:aminopeptidase-like protein